jgi:hypothetical protein
LFPLADSGDDGYKAQASLVGCFPANGFGLIAGPGSVVLGSAASRHTLAVIAGDAPVLALAICARAAIVPRDLTRPVDRPAPCTRSGASASADPAPHGKPCGPHPSGRRGRPKGTRHNAVLARSVLVGAAPHNAR